VCTSEDRRKSRPSAAGGGAGTGGRGYNGLFVEAKGHGIPTDSAFLALGYHSLGRKEEARNALAKYRKLMKHPDYDTPGNRAVLVPLLTEVEARLE